MTFVFQNKGVLTSILSFLSSSVFVRLVSRRFRKALQDDNKTETCVIFESVECLKIALLMGYSNANLHLDGLRYGNAEVLKQLSTFGWGRKLRNESSTAFDKISSREVLQFCKNNHIGGEDDHLVARCNILMLQNEAAELDELMGSSVGPRVREVMQSDWTVIPRAACMGNLAILEVARKHSVPIDRHVLTHVLFNGKGGAAKKVETAQWLIVNVYNKHVDKEKLVIAMYDGDPALIKMLSEYTNGKEDKLSEDAAYAVSRFIERYLPDLSECEGNDFLFGKKLRRLIMLKELGETAIYKAIIHKMRANGYAPPALLDKIFLVLKEELYVIIDE